ncbi:hypothetical protein ACFE04_018527 [Oxalis oulophora]
MDGGGGGGGGGRLLHGILYVAIFGIDKIPSRRQRYGIGFLDQFKRTLLRHETVGTKIYATVNLDKTMMARTTLIENRRSIPQKTQSFRIYCAHDIKDVVFKIMEHHPAGPKSLGRAYIHVADISGGFIVDKSVDILDIHLNPIPGKSRIHVKLQFLSVTQDATCHWSRGLVDAGFPGVPCAFFKQREGCKVTLYQDAHVPHNFSLRIPLAGGNHYYEPNRCWEDIFEAICNAKHFIYITGWSVYAPLALVRDGERQNELLGDILKRKADEGVIILLLLWDDRNSVDVHKLKSDGMMVTQNQETADYFRNSKVICILCPRTYDSEKNYTQNPTIFTHHQKTVIVDCVHLEGSGKRTIVTFLGGIDLCKGRYDTQDHSLFSSLETIHKHDFHQPNFPEASVNKGGPRAPWHDIHCKIEGPAAWDVLYNFEQRWTKLAGTRFLIPKIKLEEFIIRPSNFPMIEDSETWKVQIFRSIDSNSADGFPINQYEASRFGLAIGNEGVFDKSVQDAYINAIRRAKNFIYIETERFIGSSFGWKEKDNDIDLIGASNLIPKEISLKIVSKIKLRERFTVYIVIPMWPEGFPESKSVQAILDWQRRTIEMMYTDITQALHQIKLDTNPREYLTIFCLGNREKEQPGENIQTEAAALDSAYRRAQIARRFKINVNSKLIIVDDEYIIVGSANINQRSMDGERDTEIAMGAFQPNYLAAEKGQIYGFRMALWHEHLGLLETSFQHPESLKCVQLLNQFADENWEIYSSNGSSLDLPCHLLRYPIEIMNNGEISYMPEFKVFPDTNAFVLGRKAVDEHYPLLTT